MKRRLAAILAADVVGFSRLMGEDEAGTLARLESLRKELVQAKIRESGGRTVKLMGDGLLAEFSSVVEAVQCAVDIQRELAAREVGLSDDRRIRLRIGVNLGDIIVQGSDIYGGGVNLAARLEGFAEPDGICISGKVYEEVRNKIPIAFEDVGLQRFKNITEAVRVYRWTAAAADSVPATAQATSEPLLPGKPSIAVLPFVNLSGDPEQEYFADGISEDLITALSKIRWFFVIARNSSFTYKGQAVDVTNVAQELGVRYVIEGSVRKAGNRVRVSAQLIDATTGRHVWAEWYDRQSDNIFDLQDEMTRTIIGTVEPEISAAERDRVLGRPPESLDAWENYHRGLWQMWSYERDSHLPALNLFKRAIELDPGFATAHAYLSYVHYQGVIMGWAEDSRRSLEEGKTAARKALALDDRDPAAHFATGRIHMLEGQHDHSIAFLETAIRLNPNFAKAYHGLGMVLTLAGRLEEAKAALSQSERLSPRDPIIWASTAVHALACILSRDDEEALHWAHKTARNPRSAGYWPHAVLAAALAHLGRMNEARASVDAALKAKPDLTLAYLAKTLPTVEPDGLQPYLDGLNKAGLE